MQQLDNSLALFCFYSPTIQYKKRQNSQQANLINWSAQVWNGVTEQKSDLWNQFSKKMLFMLVPIFMFAYTK
jgi:hypothetical protein